MSPTLVIARMTPLMMTPRESPINRTPTGFCQGKEVLHPPRAALLVECDHSPGHSGKLPRLLADPMKQLARMVRAHRELILSWSRAKG